MDDHHLPISDGLPGYVEGAGDLGKPFGPVQPVAGVGLSASLIHGDLYPVAVEFDFMQPLLPLWGALGFRVASWGLMNPGIGVLEPRIFCRIVILAIRFSTNSIYKSCSLIGFQQMDDEFCKQ